MKHAAATFLAAVLTFAANAAPVRQATETWVTNKIDAIVGTNTAAKIASATNATLAASKQYTDAEIAAAGMSPVGVTNIANAVVASSNLCTVAAAQAMTNDAAIVRFTDVQARFIGNAKIQEAVSAFDCQTAQQSATADFATSAMWSGITDTPTTLGGYGITDGLQGYSYGDGIYFLGTESTTYQSAFHCGSIYVPAWTQITSSLPGATTLPQYLDNLVWRTTGNRSLADYGITNVASSVNYATVTSIVESAAVTNGGAKAYADATFMPKTGTWQTGSVVSNRIDTLVKLHDDIPHSLTPSREEVYIAQGFTPTQSFSQQGYDTELGLARRIILGIDTNESFDAFLNRRNAYLKSDIDGLSVTNAGALVCATNTAFAYADSNFIKGFIPANRTHYKVTNDIVFYHPNYNNKKKYSLGVSYGYSYIDGIEKVILPSYTLDAIEVSGPLYRLTGNQDNSISLSREDIRGINRVDSKLYIDGTPVATSNMVERIVASKPAPSPLTGKTYDFANGSNFTMRVYTTLTNVIQTLGGTVANPPNFTP